MEGELISVIVPIYNVERYLSRCLESIVGQSYKNLDVLLLDDGSTDESGSIADYYANSYDFIRVIHKKNEGIGVTRNLGIRESQGNYVIFVDSDDYIDEKMIETLYLIACNYSCDLVCCNKYRVFEKNNKGKETNQNLDTLRFFTQEEALGEFLLTNYIDVVFWNKLIKKNLFIGVTCPDHIYEDVSVIYKIIMNATKIANINTPLYYYCQRESSITDEKYNEKMSFLKEAVDDNYTEILKIYPQLESKLILGKLHWYVVIYDKIILNNGVDKKLLRDIQNTIKHKLNIILESSAIGNKKKLQYVLLLFSDFFYRISYKMFYKLKR